MTIPQVVEHLVFEISDFVDPRFCQEIIDLAKGRGFEQATITSQDGTAVEPDIRNNDRIILDDMDLALKLWPKVSSYFEQPFKGFEAIGLNERFRIYRYTVGQFFDWHQDGEFANSDGSVSKFTLMIYLNEVHDGGGTTFADVFSPFAFQDFTITPSTGKALLFHHPLSHRGDPILSGEKYVLRTDVMFKVSKK